MSRIPLNNSEMNITRILLILAFLGIAYFAISFGADAYYSKGYQNNSPFEAIKAQFYNKINLETDAYELSQMGMGYLKADNLEFARAAFSKATEVDPKYRDAWVWLGYTEVKIGDPDKAIAALKEAEKIDPNYRLTFQIEVAAYKEKNDQAAAQKAQEKLSYLEKTEGTE